MRRAAIEECRGRSPISDIEPRPQYISIEICLSSRRADFTTRRRRHELPEATFSQPLPRNDPHGGRLSKKQHADALVIRSQAILAGDPSHRLLLGARGLSATQNKSHPTPPPRMKLVNTIMPHATPRTTPRSPGTTSRPSPPASPRDYQGRSRHPITLGTTPQSPRRRGRPPFFHRSSGRRRPSCTTPHSGEAASPVDAAPTTRDTHP